MVVDEINSLEDVQVVQSIVDRGIRVIAGASACTSLASLLTHPDLGRLVRRTTAVGRSLVPQGRSLRYCVPHKCAALVSVLQSLSWSVLTVDVAMNPGLRSCIQTKLMMLQGG